LDFSMPNRMRRTPFAALCAVLLLALAAPQAQAVTVTIEAFRDNTLIETADGSRSNGAFERTFSGRTNQATGSIRRAVLAFDIASAVPAGSTIQSVSLQLTHLSSNGPEDAALHRLLADWGEGSSSSTGGSGAPSATGDATWLHTFYSTSFWTNAGGDFNATASAVTGLDLAATSLPTWSSAQMTADVQGWLDAPASQFGWILIGNESTNQTSQSFGSREQALAADRPLLTVEFVPEPGTGVLLTTGLAALSAVRRRARTH
jgi:hypothetical protein